MMWMATSRKQVTHRRCIAVFQPYSKRW